MLELEIVKTQLLKPIPTLTGYGFLSYCNYLFIIQHLSFKLKLKFKTLIIKSVPLAELSCVEPIAEAMDKGETASISFSTENTSSWLREHNMDADIHSYARARLLRKDEYFFRIWHYAKKLFE